MISLLISVCLLTLHARQICLYYSSYKNEDISCNMLFKAINIHVEHQLK